MNFPDNLTDLDMNEALENIEKLNNSQKKNSITDFFNLKRLSAASLFLHNHFNRHREPPGEPKFNREGSNSSLGKNSLRMRVNNMNNSDQLKLIRSLSQISNIANYDYENKRESRPLSATRNEIKIDQPKIDSQPRLPSISNEEFIGNDMDRSKGFGNISN